MQEWVKEQEEQDPTSVTPGTAGVKEVSILLSLLTSCGPTYMELLKWKERPGCTCSCLTSKEQERARGGSSSLNREAVCQSRS